MNCFLSKQVIEISRENKAVRLLFGETAYRNASVSSSVHLNVGHCIWLCNLCLVSQILVLQCSQADESFLLQSKALCRHDVIRASWHTLHRLAFLIVSWFFLFYFFKLWFWDEWCSSPLSLYENCSGFALKKTLLLLAFGIEGNPMSCFYFCLFLHEYSEHLSAWNCSMWVLTLIWWISQILYSTYIMFTKAVLLKYYLLFTDQYYALLKMGFINPLFLNQSWCKHHWFLETWQNGHICIWGI